MGTLNPKILSPELAKALNAATVRKRTLNRPFLTPGLLLLIFASDIGSAADRLLTGLATERSFRLDELAISAEALVRAVPGLNADLVFTDQSAQPVRMSTELVIVLDEGRRIAEACEESQIGTEHALGGLAVRGVGTSALLRRYGISQDMLVSRLTTPTFKLSGLTVTPMPDVVPLRDAQTIGHERTSGSADVFMVTGENIDVDVYYVQWANGEREVRLGRVRSGPPPIIRADNRRRLEIPTRYVLRRDNVEYWYVCLRQARIKTEEGWCGLFRATLEELDEGSGSSVESTLLSLGACGVGTQKQLWNETNRARFLYAAMFPPNNKIVPVAAFVLTRILPLLNGVKAKVEEV